MRSLPLQKKGLTSALSEVEVIEAHATGDVLRNADLSALINDVSYYLNIKEPATAQQVSAVSDFLRTEFGNLTTGDVLMAFKKAASGKLNIDPEHYNNLSILYWGKIMSAYSSFLKEEKQHHRSTQAPADYDDISAIPINEETKRNIDKLLAELAAKKTAWRDEHKPKERSPRDVLIQRLIQEWQQARAAWVKETLGRWSDYPVRMETYIEQRMTELDTTNQR